MIACETAIPFRSASALFPLACVDWTAFQTVAVYNIFNAVTTATAVPGRRLIDSALLCSLAAGLSPPSPKAGLG
eukprot:COSAG01_NODE_29007_length_647_cov_2.414234_2_plen_74_part_00